MLVSKFFSIFETNRQNTTIFEMRIQYVIFNDSLSKTICFDYPLDGRLKWRWLGVYLSAESTKALFSQTVNLLSFQSERLSRSTKPYVYVIFLKTLFNCLALCVIFGTSV